MPFVSLFFKIYRRTSIFAVFLSAILCMCGLILWSLCHTYNKAYLKFLYIYWNEIHFMVIRQTSTIFLNLHTVVDFHKNTYRIQTGLFFLIEPKIDLEHFILLFFLEKNVYCPTKKEANRNVIVLYFYFTHTTVRSVLSMIVTYTVKCNVQE